MAHLRPRHIQVAFETIRRFSPLVGIVGHRQVGKTTFLEQVCEEYLSFDDRDHIEAARRSPKDFLAQLKKLGTALDESQLVPELFPALKERVRMDKRPGQFFLSGSVRFTSKTLIRESLTGRIVTLEIYPLVVSELDSTALPNWLSSLLHARSLHALSGPEISSKIQKKREGLLSLYDFQGGLPGVCFIRKDTLRSQRIGDQLDTILTRDLREISKTSLTPPEITRFLQELSLLDGSPIEFEDLRRKTGLTPRTQKKILFGLEALFLIRPVPIEGDRKGVAYFLEDQAESRYLSQGRLSTLQAWRGLIYRHLRIQAVYLVGENISTFQYRSRSGVLVPIVFRSPEGVIGFMPILTEGPSHRDKAQASSFLRRYADSKLIFVPVSGRIVVHDDRTATIPATHLLWP